MICGKVARAADDPLAATNPIVLVEVTSPSTEAHDRGTKLKWSPDEASAGGEVDLRSIGASPAR